MTLEESGEPTRHVTALSHAECQAHKTETISEFKIHSLLERYTVVSSGKVIDVSKVRSFETSPPTYQSTKLTSQQT